MMQIRPVSDLRNKYPEIEEAVLRSGQPVYLTKNGYGTMVLMSLEQYAALTEDVERRLDEADLLAITQGLLRQEAQRFEALGLHLEVPEAAARRLAELGRSADFGARPLRRVIRREITDRGAQMRLEGSAEAGDTLRAISEGGQIRLIKSE